MSADRRRSPAGVDTAPNSPWSAEYMTRSLEPDEGEVPDGGLLTDVDPSSSAYPEPIVAWEGGPSTFGNDPLTDADGFVEYVPLTPQPDTDEPVVSDRVGIRSPRPGPSRTFDADLLEDTNWSRWVPSGDDEWDVGDDEPEAQSGTDATEARHVVNNADFTAEHASHLRSNSASFVKPISIGWSDSGAALSAKPPRVAEDGFVAPTSFLHPGHGPATDPDGDAAGEAYDGSGEDAVGAVAEARVSGEIGDATFVEALPADAAGPDAPMGAAGEPVEVLPPVAHGPVETIVSPDDVGEPVAVSASAAPPAVPVEPQPAATGGHAGDDTDEVEASFEDEGPDDRGPEDEGREADGGHLPFEEAVAPPLLGEARVEHGYVVLGSDADRSGAGGATEDITDSPTGLGPGLAWTALIASVAGPETTPGPTPDAEASQPAAPAREPSTEPSGDGTAPVPEIDGRKVNGNGNGSSPGSHAPDVDDLPTSEFTPYATAQPVLPGDITFGLPVLRTDDVRGTDVDRDENAHEEGHGDGHDRVNGSRVLPEPDASPEVDEAVPEPTGVDLDTAALLWSAEPEAEPELEDVPDPAAPTPSADPPPEADSDDPDVDGAPHEVATEPPQMGVPTWFPALGPGSPDTDLRVGETTEPTEVVVADAEDDERAEDAADRSAPPAAVVPAAGVASVAWVSRTSETPEIDVAQEAPESGFVDVEAGTLDVASDATPVVAPDVAPVVSPDVASGSVPSETARGSATETIEVAPVASPPTRLPVPQPVPAPAAMPVEAPSPPPPVEAPEPERGGLPLPIEAPDVVAHRKRRRRMALGIGAAAILVVLVAIFLRPGVEGEADRTSGPPGRFDDVQTVDDLEVGTCFNSASATLVTVTVVPCDEPHDYEFLGQGEIPQAPDAPYPGGDTLRTQTRNECENRFVAYTGKPVAETTLSIFWLYPSDASWQEGDRTFVCALESASKGVPLNSSQAATG